ncbi:hypothetical protein KM043_003496 [Ampulex compressa]|nr:hypothetical protein KM043_003496 [Ampulex compressa]
METEETRRRRRTETRPDNRSTNFLIALSPLSGEKTASSLRSEREEDLLSPSRHLHVLRVLVEVENRMRTRRLEKGTTSFSRIAWEVSIPPSSRGGESDEGLISRRTPPLLGFWKDRRMLVMIFGLLGCDVIGRWRMNYCWTMFLGRIADVLGYGDVDRQ